MLPIEENEKYIKSFYAEDFSDVYITKITIDVEKIDDIFETIVLSVFR